MSYTVSIHAATDQGFIRNENQDAILIDDELIQCEEASYSIEQLEPDDSTAGVPVFVADGMGGNAGGKQASFTALDAVREFKQLDTGEIDAQKTIAFISRKVKNMAMESRYYKPGTTLSGLFLKHHEMISLHAGDSRIYKYATTDKSLTCLTQDHNLGNDPAYAATHPQQYKQKQSQLLTNFVGCDNCKADSIILDDFQQNDIYMLCTDGLHGYIDFETIKHILEQNAENPAVCLQHLIKITLNTGGYDNVSVILVKILDIKHSIARSREEN